MDEEASAFATRGVRAGIDRSQFNEHSEALYMTSSLVFESAEQAAGRFIGGESGYVYSRGPGARVGQVPAMFK